MAWWDGNRNSTDWHNDNESKKASYRSKDDGWPFTSSDKDAGRSRKLAEMSEGVSSKSDQDGLGTGLFGRVTLFFKK